ncbi:MAG TPA: ABC transporter permease [Opitutae bacterium]|nr:ABC transporter permease [Puniceicoccaceae bacterium]HBR94343.1 ABC transporter permease [Opitutae bacterium]
MNRDKKTPAQSSRQQHGNSSTPLTEDGSTLIIRPHRSWLSIDWHGLWEYRDMLRFLIIRDFVSKYKQTVLGPAWFVIQPLFMTLVFTVIFGKVAGISTDGLPQTLFYLSGLLGWNYFAQTFLATSSNLIVNANLFRKVYFPRIIVPASVTISNLIAFTIQLITFGAFWIYFKYFTEAANTFAFSPWAWLFPVLVLQTGALSLGIGLWMSALAAKYRDLHNVSNFIIQAWMYITPVIYPLSSIPEHWRWVVNLNPMTTVVESYRLLFLGQGTLDSGLMVQSAVITIFVLLSGVIVYNRIQRNFVDYS